MIGSEEEKSLQGLFAFWGENPTVIDIGSNKGGWADVVINEYGDDCNLHLFEPNSKLLSFTEIKYEYRKNITYNELAAFDKNGEISFYYFENFNNELSSVFNGGDEWAGLPMKERKVNAIKIDDYCKQNNLSKVDCIKIDAEGADYYCLLGCENLLSTNSVKFVLIEYGYHYKRANATFLDVIKLCSKYGYKIYYYLIDNYWEVTEDSFTEDFRFENFVITKERIKNLSIGWNNELIKNTADLPKTDFILELGCYEGLSSKYLAENMLEGGRIICVDPLEDYYTEQDVEHKDLFIGQYGRFRRNTKGLPIELRRQKSEVALPEMNAFRFGFIYVDGDHSEKSVYFDCVWSFALCKPHGHILIDDYEWREETKSGIDKFISEFGGSMQIIKKEYQVLIKKIANQYNDLTQKYYL